MQAIAELRGWTSFAALPLPYNLTERTVERELMPMAHEMGLGVFPWSPLAGGVLSGKFQAPDLVAAKNAGPLDSRQKINVATGRPIDRNLAITTAARETAHQPTAPPPQVAFPWTTPH